MVVVVVAFLAVVVATFVVVVFTVAGFGVSEGAGAEVAGAAGAGVRASGAGAVLTRTGIGFVGRPRSMVVGRLEPSTMSASFAVLLVTAGALLSAE